MNDRIHQFQVLFELSMSIHHGLNLNETITNTLKSYLQKLNCSAGAVFQFDRKNIPTLFTCIPQKTNELPEFAEAQKYLKQLQHGDFLSFLDSLPFIYNGEESSATIMNLPNFGILLLIRKTIPFDNFILGAIRRINDKFAEACRFCIQENKIMQMNKDLERRVSLRTLQLENSNQKLIETQKRFVQQERLAAIGEVSAGIAHEINNPISFISSNFNALKESLKIIETFFLQTDLLEQSFDAEDETQANSILLSSLELKQNLNIPMLLQDITEIISESEIGLKRVSAIVQSLRHFSYSDQSKKTMNEYNLNQGVENTLLLSKYSCRNIQNIVFKKGSIPLFLANGGEINQVLLNLVINAADSINSLEDCSDSELKIQTFVQNNAAVCTISDSGLGIPKNVMSKIFQPFYTTKSNGKGTGLGLSICKDIIEKRHNGKLYAESPREGGAKFVIEIPLNEASGT